ncbi:NAD(P)/FAD-dependent oxidoreductase [Pseudonocardia sp. RS010]|uniref:NAD(P)/FAD-dependent oxidoreductase n=1 Tax=Pseudonocardia sp. RS010 TaxID=3385979 RepID=UPI0039A231A3
MTDAPTGTAVVLGASIGGAATAAALAPYFARVTVLDRDDLPDSPQKRKGVPHGYQFHTLTIGGRHAMEALFPGLPDDLRKLGVPESCATADVRYASKCGYFPRFESELMMLQPTRRLLEWYLRDRSSRLEGVDFVPNTTVTGLTAEDGAITGVTAVDATGNEVAYEADLVVDTSGRASKTPDFLAALGYPAPVEKTVNARWGYATTYVRPPESWDPGFKSMYIGPTVSGEGPTATRGGAMWCQEDGQWVVTAQGCAGDYPPADPEGFRDYMGSFGSQAFTEVLDRFEIISPFEAWRNTTNRLRDYAGLQSRPENLIVLGDASAAFNPIYGQGMASAAMGARLLREYLDEGATLGAGFAEGFQKRLDEQVTQPCWAFSTGSDYAVPGVEVDGVTVDEADRPESSYTDRVLALATEDKEVTIKFWETVHILRGPEWMADEDLQNRVKADWDRLGNLSRKD